MGILWVKKELSQMYLRNPALEAVTQIDFLAAGLLWAFHALVSVKYLRGDLEQGALPRLTGSQSILGYERSTEHCRGKLDGDVPLPSFPLFLSQGLSRYTQENLGKPPLITPLHPAPLVPGSHGSWLHTQLVPWLAFSHLP